jgi:hypothetical protein
MLRTWKLRHRFGRIVDHGRSGVANSAFYFDTDNDEVSLPTSLVSGNAGTYSFWFRSDDVVTGGAIESSFTPFFVRQQTSDPVAAMQIALSIGTSTSVVDGEILGLAGKTATVPDFRGSAPPLLTPNIYQNVTLPGQGFYCKKSR